MKKQYAYDKTCYLRLQQKEDYEAPANIRQKRLKRYLSNVFISIPLGTNAPPNVISCDSGNYRHNRTNEELVWEIELIDDGNKSGALEFNVPIRDAPDSFFPIDVSFLSQAIQAGVAVGSVQHCETGQGIQYNVTTTVTTDSYKVE